MSSSSCSDQSRWMQTLLWAFITFFVLFQTFQFIHVPICSHDIIVTSWLSLMKWSMCVIVKCHQLNVMNTWLLWITGMQVDWSWCVSCSLLHWPQHFNLCTCNYDTYCQGERKTNVSFENSYTRIVLVASFLCKQYVSCQWHIHIFYS